MCLLTLGMIEPYRWFLRTLLLGTIFCANLLMQLSVAANFNEETLNGLKSMNSINKLNRKGMNVFIYEQINEKL